MNHKKGNNDMHAAPVEDTGFIDMKEEAAHPVTRGMSRKKRRQLKRARPSQEAEVVAAEMKEYVGSSDYGTPMLREKAIAMGAFREENAEPGKKRARILVQIPLDYYVRQKWVSIREYEAGKEFHMLWYYGAIKTGYAQMKYTTQGGGMPPYDIGSVLTDRYKRAKLSIQGLVQALLCYNVCCLGEWVKALKPEDLNDEVIGKNRRMQLLRNGLTDLANHFRFPENMVERVEDAQSKSPGEYINLNQC